jgi:hypothetical protein
MRSDLDAVRERHVLRETRDELLRVQSGDWAWAKTYVQAHHPQEHPGLRSADPNRLSILEGRRPGTAEGGF